MTYFEPIYTINLFEDLPSIISMCFNDAKARAGNGNIMDFRAWMQIWNESNFGFDAEGKLGKFIVPCVIVKYRHNLRYVYHDGRFAYELNREVAIPYYNAVIDRKMPGARDWRSYDLID